MMIDRLNWDDSKVFLALAREGTLSAAAQSLSLGVATVSRRVERLEQALGLPLFLRTQTGYALTDQGEALLPKAEAIERAMQALRQEASDHDQIRGTVRLTCIESLVEPFLLPALSPLLEANPGLDVEILFSTATLNLHRHDADLAIRMVRPETGHLKSRLLVNMGLGLYGPDSGPRPDRLITWPQTEGLSTLIRWAETLASPAAPRLVLNTLSAQVEAVRLGLGSAVLPHFLARAAGLALITDTLPDGTRMHRPLYLVTHADLAASRRVSAVADCIATHITQNRQTLSEP